VEASTVQPGITPTLPGKGLYGVTIYRVYEKSRCIALFTVQDHAWRASQEPDAPAALIKTGQAESTLPLCNVCPFIGKIFVNTYFLAKTSCIYTMNYLHQEKCLRDQEAKPGEMPDLFVLTNLSGK
jgi:hypothetical protein